MEKRTKVRARVTAYSLKELITQASQVIIMGHEMADYDSFGAAIGVAKAVQDLGRRAWVVIDDHNPAIDKLLNLLPKSPLLDTLVKTSQVQRVLNPDTLLIVVDTHKPSLLAEPKLINKAREVVVIDHHRRGEEFIAEAKLVYMETYASSTCELVTELLQYLGDQVEIGKFEATALLAGITVDTKNFIYQTGVRTFEAASYLRSVGAEPSIVQKILRDDMATVRKKAEVIRNARIICGQTALGVSREISPDAQLLAAKTADALLNIAEVNAAFVLWPFQGGTAISARSTGEVNVQAITERLGGGGHLTIAAAQVNDTLENTEKTLLQILEEVFCKEV
jgi:c-di-AMP phosphodiesterase-like protein